MDLADNIAVKVEHLTKGFGGMPVLDDISLHVNDGENLVVFGRSGTGKSVLLKCIIGLMKPEAGDVFVHGTNVLKVSIKELNEIRKNIGFLFQGAALYDSMSVRQNLEFPLKRHFNFSQKEIDDKIMYTLELVSLTEAIDKMPSELSGGMKKRIGLARSIISEPRLMLYDEPTTGLDPITSKEISELIINLQKHLKMTSIAVTHDLMCAKIIADRAIFIKDSKIAYEGSIETLTNSTDKFLINFFSYDLVKES